MIDGDKSQINWRMLARHPRDWWRVARTLARGGYVVYGQTVRGTLRLDGRRPGFVARNTILGGGSVRGIHISNITVSGWPPFPPGGKENGG